MFCSCKNIPHQIFFYLELFWYKDVTTMVAMRRHTLDYDDDSIADDVDSDDDNDDEEEDEEDVDVWKSRHVMLSAKGLLSFSITGHILASHALLNFLSLNFIIVLFDSDIFIINKIDCPHRHFHHDLYLNHDLHLNCPLHIDHNLWKMCNKKVEKEKVMGAPTLYEICSIAPCHS